MTSSSLQLACLSEMQPLVMRVDEALNILCNTYDQGMTSSSLQLACLCEMQALALGVGEAADIQFNTRACMIWH